MVLISLVSVLNLLYFYIGTFRSMCAVPNMAVFCSSLILFIIIIIIIIIVIVFALLSVSFLLRHFNEYEMMTVGGGTRKQILTSCWSENSKINSLEVLSCRLQDNIEICLRGVVHAEENWRHQAIDRDKYRTITEAVMNVRVP